MPGRPPGLETWCVLQAKQLGEAAAAAPHLSSCGLAISLPVFLNIYTKIEYYQNHAKE